MMRNYTKPLPDATKFSMADPMFLFGLVAFMINRYADNAFSLPVGDLFFPFLAFYLSAKDELQQRLLAYPGALLAFLLMFLITVSNVYNEVGWGHQLRNGYATFTLFITVYFFAISEKRKELMSYVLGTIIAFGLYFIVLAGISLVTEGTIVRSLRGEQPTPIVAIALYALLRPQLTRAMRFWLLASGGFTAFVAIIIQARGPLVSLILAGIIYLAARFSPKPRTTIVLMLAFGLLMHFISTLFVPSAFNVVADGEAATISNMQRAHSIDFSRHMMDQHPWLGISMETFFQTFNPDFVILTGYTIADTVSTPHNAFLEYATFFGYPVGILFVLLILRMVGASLQTPAMARSFFVACCIAGIIRIGAFFGFSGWLRVEWFALIFALYYAYALPVKASAKTTLHRIGNKRKS